jgi:eukaryotic-like serine/threonine-protein kinase
MSAWVVPGYTEERELGHGASARVVAATHNDSGQQVAIKYLAPRLLSDPNFLARFREEVGLLASIDVPHVVRLFDYVEVPGEGAAIVMELVDGVSLHEMITRQGATSPEAALVVLKGSLLGLAAAHQLGIVHRDYKPENVLVDGAGNSKLTDFGVAVKAGERAPVGGTPLYMAPEQWNGEPATPATDIYAATAVFFECLTGQTPFSGRRLEHLAMQHQTAPIPVGLFDQPVQALIERGLAKNPRDRPAHAVEFVAELNEVADGAYGADWEERGRSELAKRAAALLLLLLGGIAGAAGGSFAATLLGGMGRKKKAVIAGAALGIFAAIAVTTTTLALTGNNGSGSPGATNRAADAAATNSGTAGPPGTGSPATGPSTTGSPTASPSTTGSPTASPSATSPTTNPPTGAPTTAPPATAPPPLPVITAAAANPAAVSGTCPAKLPSLTVPGTISSDRATTVTYHWARSNGTSTGATTAEIPAGGSVSVPDSVTAASNQWQITDTLMVTSPSAHSAAATVSVQCEYPTLTVTNPSQGALLRPPLDEPYKLSVTASGGNGPYNWSDTGSTLPPGLSFGGGVITGTPTTEGRFRVTITVTDTEASPQSFSVSFIIDPAGIT